MGAVWVDYEQLAQLRGYRRKTGVSITRSVEETLSIWLERIAWAGLSAWVWSL
jgi:hypothetical protein